MNTFKRTAAIFFTPSRWNITRKSVILHCGPQSGSRTTDMEVVYEAGEEERQLSECEWHEEGDDDLREYVLGSRAYEVLKDKPIRKIQVWVDET